MRACIIGLCLCLCGWGGVQVNAAEAQTVYLLESDGGAGDRWTSRTFYLVGTYTPEEIIFLTFCYFFYAADYGVPPDVRVLGIKREGDSLIVNVSGEILQYGGSANENALVTQCKKVAGAFPAVERLTVLIDAVAQPLPEGTRIEDLPVK